MNDQIRMDKVNAGREILSVGAVGGVPYQPKRQQFKSNKSPKQIAPKGHEAFLKALESSGATVNFEKASSGAIITGVIKHSDKYTVSVTDANGDTRVLFKHDISEFSPAARQEAVN